MRYAVVALIVAGVLRADTYYVDCRSGSDSAAATSPQSAWKTLVKVSAMAFAPGDSILLRRGTRCSGPFSPGGSGEEGRPCGQNIQMR